MKGNQILKCRDDLRPVFLSRMEETAGVKRLFVLAEDTECSWLKQGEECSPSILRGRIEPWLTALFQSEHLGLLIGSGLTHAVHHIATGKSLPGMDPVAFTHFDTKISNEAHKSAVAAGRGNGNIEDQIRVVNDLIRGLEIINSSDSKINEKLKTLEAEIDSVLSNFAASILEGENGFITAEEKQREEAFNYLVSFLMSFASRTGTRDRLQIFTTNYDRLIEAGAESAGLHLLDRFVGSLAPVFRSSRLNLDMHYNPPGIRGEPRYLEGVAKFTKLHGSVDWVNTQRSIRRIGVPFGAPSIDPYLNAPGLYGAQSMQLMIYPNSAKDRETAAYPYVELFRDFAAAICRPNSTLISFGYSFGDEHINRVLEDMLTIPSTHLVIISFDDPLDRIMHMYEKIGRYAQITLLIGDHLGDFRSLVDNYLPKPAIDRTTIRMAELLKDRWNANHGPMPPESKSPKDLGESGA